MVNKKTILGLFFLTPLFLLTAGDRLSILEETASLCEQGSSSECYSLGALHLNGVSDLNISKNTSSAILAFKKSCDAKSEKSQKACAALGGIYSGYYDEHLKNGEKAIEYFGQACLLGAGEICYSVGTLYLSGTSTTKSQPLAKEYYLSGCMLKDEKSCNALDDLTAPAPSLLKHKEDVNGSV